MDVVAVVFGAVLALAAVAVFVRQPSVDRLPVLLNHERSAAEQLNVDGDGEALLQELPTLSVGNSCRTRRRSGSTPKAVAEKPALHEYASTAFLEALLRVNAAEPLSELGRYDEALALLDFRSEHALVEGGRRCSRAWILAMLGRAGEARALLENVDAVQLYEYQCEYWLTLAFVHRESQSLDDCEAALHNADQTVVRAASERNLAFHGAELHRARGDVTRALAHYEAGARHRWRWQGGSGLLNWGTLLAELGRHDEARAGWLQCVTQDPLSLAAGEAKRRLES